MMARSRYWWVGPMPPSLTNPTPACHSTVSTFAHHVKPGKAGDASTQPVAFTRNFDQNGPYTTGLE